MASLSPEQIAAARRARMQRLARSAATVAGSSWSQVDPGDVARSWARLLGRPLAALIGAQTAAAQTADAYIDEALAAQEIEAAAAGAVVPASLAGIASDGRPLASLLYQPAIQVLQLIKAGAPAGDALQSGRLSLDMITRTQVADAARAAVGVGVAARGVGYVRVLTPPSCSRCAILAGRYYRWNTGFQRHPRCDCQHLPTTERHSHGLRTDGRAYFGSLSRGEQDRIFTKAGAEAIRDGADLGQVVNARRGMTAAGTTTESTTRRGVARPGRLMPEEIYRRAVGNRAEAVRMLEQHGYIVPRPAGVAPAPPPVIRAAGPVQPKPKAATRGSVTPLTKGDIDALHARRSLTFAEARLQRAATDAERKAIQGEIVHLRERIARSGTTGGYNFSSSWWDQPGGSRVTGVPDSALLHARIESRVDAGIPAVLRNELVGEMRLQAELAPRAVLELHEIQSLAKFDMAEQAGSLAYYERVTRKISFNPDWVSGRAAIDRASSHSLASGWWTRRGADRGTAAGTLAHEFGHHIGGRVLSTATYEQTVTLAAAFDAGLETGGAIAAAVRRGRDFPDAVDDWLAAASHRAYAKARVSDYGATNWSELTAEIWHEYSTAGPRARAHIRAMGTALRDLCEGFEVVEL